MSVSPLFAWQQHFLQKEGNVSHIQPMGNKEKIIALIEKAISLNVIGDKQYASRFKGFIAELDFPQFADHVWPEVDVFPGGFLVSPMKDARSISNPVHFNTGTHDPRDLVAMYEKLEKLGCSNLFYFHFENSVEVEAWSQNGFPNGFLSPPYKVHEYSRHSKQFERSSIDAFCALFEDRKEITKSKPIPKNVKEEYSKKLESFSEASLADLYFLRLVFDTLIGRPKVHGLPSDIDFICFSTKRSEPVILEVKEKDISKREPKGFGMDIPRMDDLLELQSKTGMKAFYIVREVADQREREFLRWRSISLNTFSQNLGRTIQGGSGMGFESGKYPTKVCPEEFFKRIE